MALKLLKGLLLNMEIGYYGAIIISSGLIVPSLCVSNRNHDVTIKNNISFQNFYIFITAATSEPQTPAQQIDYNFARDEIMLNELSNDPIQTAISRLEKQHEEDKQGYNHNPIISYQYLSIFNSLKLYIL